MDKKSIVLLITVILVTFLVFAKTLSFDFINWDDDINVYKNEVFQQENPFRDIWFSLKLPSFLPLTYSLFYLQWKLGGGTPFIFHLFSLIFHILNAILIFYFLKKLKFKSALIFFVVLIYSIHPARVESVAWITEQKSLLSGIFIWLSFLVFLRYNRDRRITNLLLVGFFYLLALLSKQTAFPLFLIFLAYNFFVLEEKPNLSWFKLIGILGSIGLSVMAINWLRESKNFIGTFAFSLGMLSRIIICFKSFSYYILRIIFPFGLLPIYSRWKVSSRLIGDYLPILFILSISGYIFYIYKKDKGPLRKWLPFCFCSYLLTIFPVSGIITMPYMNTSFVADRYSYFSSIFLIIMLALVIKMFFKKANILFLCFSLLCIFPTVNYLKIWKDSGIFWNYVIKNNPSCKSAYLNLGYFVMNKKNASLNDIKRAMQLHKKAMSLAPQDSLGFYNYGVCLMKLGKLKEAESYYRKSLELKPDYSDVWNDLGWILEIQGRRQEAIECYRKALKYKPGHKVALRNLRRILNKK